MCHQELKFYLHKKDNDYENDVASYAVAVGARLALRNYWFRYGHAFQPQTWVVIIPMKLGVDCC